MSASRKKRYGFPKLAGNPLDHLDCIVATATGTVAKLGQVNVESLRELGDKAIWYHGTPLRQILFNRVQVGRIVGNRIAFVLRWCSHVLISLGF